MAEISINTTQNVEINFNLATIGMRMGAYLIDFSVKYSYVMVIYNMVLPRLKIENFSADYWSDIAIQAVLYCPVIFYSLVQEIWLEGQTLGKKLLAIRVVKIDGYQASVWDFVLRWLFRVVDIIGPFWVIGLITMASNKRHQRLGDMAAGTAVIALKSRYNITHTILESLSEDYEPKYPSVVRLSDNDIRIIKESFLSASKSRDTQRMQKISDRIETVTGIVRDTTVPVFIDRVIKDYNYYTGR